jgi:hypothetical protein
VETQAEVDQMYDRLTAAHIQMEHKPRKIRDGYTLYFLGDLLYPIIKKRQRLSKTWATCSKRPLPFIY